MTGTQATLLWIYGGIIAIWPIRLIVLSIILRRQDVLTPRSPRYDQPDPPLVSAILPAKDEEANLADCLASVARQTIPISRSSSSTTAAPIGPARSPAGSRRTIPRIRVLTIEHLPRRLDRQDPRPAPRRRRGAGRMALVPGRRHAPRARGSLDHDGVRPDLTSGSLVSLLPELRCETFWEQVVQPLGGIVLMQSFPLHLVHSRRSRLAFANGQIHPDPPLGLRCRRAATRRSETGSSRTSAWHRRVKDLGLPIRVALIRGDRHVPDVLLAGAACPGLEPDPL